MASQKCFSRAVVSLLAVAMCGAVAADRVEVGADDIVSPPMYPPQAEFVVTSQWSGGYCGDLIVDHAPPTDPWQVSANLDADIVRIAGGTYRGAIEKPYNLVFTPSFGSAAIRHTISLCVEGDDILTVYGLDWGPGLHYNPLPIKALMRDFYSQQVTRPQRIVANSAEELKRLESMVGRKLDVSIDRYTVIAAFMGMRPTGGFSIEMTKAVEAPGRPNRVDVEVLSTSPGPNCYVTMALTSPVQVVAIPKTDRPIRFVEHNEVLQCDYFWEVE